MTRPRLIVIITHRGRRRDRPRLSGEAAGRAGRLLSVAVITG
jgi:hypothetical protein